MDASVLRRSALTGAALLALLLGACGDDDEAADSTTTTAPAGEPVIDPGDGGRYDPDIDPATFTDVVDNPYLPLLPGSSWVYEGISDGEEERVEVVVTGERKTVMGIDAVVVRDTVRVDGEMVEDTFDWFAQDAEGNVWYLGEETREYEDGEVVSTEGSWEAGKDGALPGIVMLADPEAGQAYRQEYLAGEAEDLGEVLRVGERVEIDLGDYEDVVVTEDWTPLEPEVVEEKSYAPGVGLILEVKTAGGDGETRVELTSFTPGEGR